MSPAMLREVSIRLRPLPSSDWITQHYSITQASEVSLAHHLRDFDGKLTVISVHLNGHPMRFEVIGKDRLMVRPMLRLEGGFLDIELMGSTPALPDARSIRPAYAAPAITYGLSAPGAIP